MDNNTYIKLIANQITSLRDSAKVELGEDHQVTIALSECITVLAGPQVVIPVGFDTQEQYSEFLTSQTSVLVDVAPDASEEETAAAVTSISASISDVVGTVVDDNGNVTEIGNMAESAATARELIESIHADNEYDAYDEFDEDLMERREVSNTISISYTRLDGKALTNIEVGTILSNPSSAALKALGSIQLLSIKEGATPSEKSAVFEVVEEGQLPLEALALNIAAYKGVAHIPGLGKVQAVGTVDFLN